MASRLSHIHSSRGQVVAVVVAAATICIAHHAVPLL